MLKTLILASMISGAHAHGSSHPKTPPPPPAQSAGVVFTADADDPVRPVIFHWDRLWHRTDGVMLVCPYELRMTWGDPWTCNAAGDTSNRGWVTIHQFKVPGYKLRSYSMFVEGSSNTRLGLIATFVKE